MLTLPEPPPHGWHGLPHWAPSVLSAATGREAAEPLSLGSD